MIWVVYIIFCLAIGTFGRNRKLGFWGYFLSSLILTPLIGLILVLATDEKEKTIADK